MSDDTSTTEGGTTDGDGPLGYEEARAELLDVVRTLEQGGTIAGGVPGAVGARGAAGPGLPGWLDGARQRLEAVVAERG